MRKMRLNLVIIFYSTLLQDQKCLSLNLIRTLHWTIHFVISEILKPSLKKISNSCFPANIVQCTAAVCLCFLWRLLVVKNHTVHSVDKKPAINLALI